MHGALRPALGATYSQGRSKGGRRCVLRTARGGAEGAGGVCASQARHTCSQWGMGPFATCTFIQDVLAPMCTRTRTHARTRAHAHTCARTHTHALPAHAQVLYNLFEWPMRPGARLAVIGISNTHDLDDRVLPRISRWVCLPAATQQKCLVGHKQTCLHAVLDAYTC